MNHDNDDSSQADDAEKRAKAEGDTLPPAAQPKSGPGAAGGDDQTVVSPQFDDRSTGLLVFGILQIIMGCFSAMLVPMMLLSTLASPASGAPTTVRMMLPAIGMYGMVAVVLIWLGVGSTLARRWARALTLVLAWMWLAMGLVSLIMMCFVMPNMLSISAQDQKVPPQAMIIAQTVMMATMGCLYIILPGIFIIFYQSKHVKATCEFKDTYPRWTDKCPLPVLSLSLFLAFGALSMPLSLSYGSVLPVFGFLLKGVPGTLVYLALAPLLAYLAWATYKMKMSAWWTTLVVYLLFGLSGLVTFSRISMMDFYREMDMPEEQLKIIEQSGMFEHMNIPLMAGLGMGVVVAYMLWVRRYFVAGTTPQEGA
ncbi:hypothetical protein CA54_47090 [Symmachiella macrocystis]|uniref:Uncharacterized protein n=1 Tax=Symmachiella macrocystis TaxID=2527985 RepID=A0A5C6BCY0_9PLAN|nr:hypothetical protein [Symmachiella macrocystis]TWU09467.1 hypothetical protein CA54_47090 [Symmachiella macrocystis]